MGARYHHSLQLQTRFKKFFYMSNTPQEVPQNRRKPRVGVFTRAIDMGTSGSGHHLLEILNHVQQINDTFDLRYIHYHRGRNSHIYTSKNEVVIPRNPLRAGMVLNRMNFDILHFHPLTIFSPIWFTRARKVATIHGAEPVIIPVHFPRHQQLHDRYLMPFYARRMDHIFTVSRTSQDFLIRQNRVDPRHVSITYNAVSPAYRTIEAEAKRKLAPFGLERPYFFHISKFSARKNPWTILKAFKEFRTGSSRDFQLLLAGKGWDGEAVTQFLDEHDLKTHVIRPGFVSEEEAVLFYNFAAAFLFPSLCEGFGMPNLEAMACGCPVITSEAFAVKEIVADAALVMSDPMNYRELSAAMERIVTEEPLRMQLIEKGKRRVTEFSWMESAHEVINRWKSLL